MSYLKPFQIRQLAIRTLSSDSFGLTAVEKVALARDHKVASWLVEGLTSLASEDLSPDALEEAVGIRTAFRLATLRNKTLSSSMMSSRFIDGSKRSSLALDSLYCVYCVKPLFSQEVRCHSCAKKLEKTTPGTIYMGRESTHTVHNRIETGDCFHFSIQFLLCSSCHSRVIADDTRCPFCAATYAPPTYPFDIRTSEHLLVSCSPTPTPSSETSVREVFKDEIREYDM